MAIGAMKIYRVLRDHVGNMNNIVVQLYKEELTALEAAAKANEQLAKVAEELTEKAKS